MLFASHAARKRHPHGVDMTLYPNALTSCESSDQENWYSSFRSLGTVHRSFLTSSRTAPHVIVSIHQGCSLQAFGDHRVTEQMSQGNERRMICSTLQQPFPGQAICPVRSVRRRCVFDQPLLSGYARACQNDEASSHISIRDTSQCATPSVTPHCQSPQKL